jgi:RNA polymerase sigma factor (sigma-70 family)
MEGVEGARDEEGGMGSSAATVVRAIRATVQADRYAVDDRELLRRFVEEGNQDAFAALVRRHAALVYGACRRALPSTQDAEDACQATFLVLVKKARGQVWQPSVASWLYATARKIAGNARQGAQRRARHESRAAVPEAVEPVDQVSGRELLAALDEELDRLPPRYREPLVLCYLEGLTRDEVATRLGVPAATVKTQLERGRKKLGDALVRRGFGLGAGLLALAITSPVRASSPRLIQAVVAAVSGSPPAAVEALAREVSVNALMSRLMRMALGVAAAVVLGIGMAALSLTASQTAGKATSAKAPARDSNPAPAAKEETISGRVLSPAGKPLAGAELLLAGRVETPRKLGVTGADGRFRVSAPCGKSWVYLVARAPGLGGDFIDLGKAPAGDVELRTVRDNAVRGRVIDTQGKPVAGVTVAVRHVGTYANNSLDGFLVAWKMRDPFSGVPPGVKGTWEEGVFPATTTGKDGRFTLTGVGSERVVALRLRGPGMAEAEVWVVNRAGFDPRPYNQATEDALAQLPIKLGSKWLLQGPDVAVVTEAEKPIRGVVKDVDTGKPRAGVQVWLSRSGNDQLPIKLAATTNARGQYEIRGARKSAKGYLVEVASEPATGYMGCQAQAADTPGFGPIALDVAMKKGVVLTGRVIDRSTGKAMPGWVMAAVLADNPFARDYPEFGLSAFWVTASTNQEGRFRVVTIPGPVVLMGGPDTTRLPEGDIARYRYTPPVPDPKYPKYFPTRKGVSLGVNAYGGRFLALQGNSCKVIEIRPGRAEVEQDVVLQRASALTVRILDDRGRPVAGTWATGVSPQSWHGPTRIAGDTCSVYHLEAGKPRLMVFHDPARKRFGTLRLEGNEKEPQVVKLGAGGTVKGRLVDEDGAPLAGAAIRLLHREGTTAAMQEHLHLGRRIESDADGKFHIDQIVPGVMFGLSASRGRRYFEPAQKLERTAPAGKVLDLGDVKLKARPGRGKI